jgi:hypothetical protein
LYTYTHFSVSFITKKLPSALVKPTNQLGHTGAWFEFNSLIAGITLGKTFFKTSDKPLFIEAFNDTIFINPSLVK